MKSLFKIVIIIILLTGCSHQDKGTLTYEYEFVDNNIYLKVINQTSKPKWLGTVDGNYNIMNENKDFTLHVNEQIKAHTTKNYVINQIDDSNDPAIIKLTTCGNHGTECTNTVCGKKGHWACFITARLIDSEECGTPVYENTDVCSCSCSAVCPSK